MRRLTPRRATRQPARRARRRRTGAGPRGRLGLSASHPPPDRDGSDVPLRERLCRQEFLFNAFKALSFNGIDGDYAEFGSSGGMTFGLAYLEARRHGHPAKLWAFDSFA